MPRTRSLVAYTLLSITIAIPSFASHGHHGFSVNIEDDQPVTSCDQLHMRSDDQEVARAEDRLTLPQSSQAVRVNAAQNGGIYVYGSDRNDFAVLNCKFAMSDDRSTAESKLQQIKTSFESGTLAVNGPEDGDWTSYLVIQAPRSSSLSLNGINGPIAFSGMTGKMEVQNTNGPLSIKNSSGEIKAEITNGPISYAGDGGDVRLRAENGPISVKLRGTSWDGKGLDAESTNGPLALKLPDHYSSGVLVQTRGYSPFHCSRCDNARK